MICEGAGAVRLNIWSCPIMRAEPGAEWARRDCGRVGEGVEEEASAGGFGAGLGLWVLQAGGVLAGLGVMSHIIPSVSQTKENSVASARA
jgi:hypothetical protein